MSNAQRGVCTWGGFPPITSTAGMVLYVNAFASVSLGSASIVVYWGTGAFATVVSSTVSLPQTLFQVAVPSGINLSGITVAVRANPSASGEYVGAYVEVDIYDIYIQ